MSEELEFGFDPMPEPTPDPKPRLKARRIEMMLTDPNVSDDMRVNLLRNIARSADDDSLPVLMRLLERASAASADEQQKEKLAEIATILAELQQGPLRCSLFDRMLDQPGLGRRARIVQHDGTTSSPTVPDEALPEKMRRGDYVWTDAKGTAILYHTPMTTSIGEEAKLERVLPGGQVLVSVGELGRSVYRASARLAEQIESDEARAGASVIVCPRRMMAFMALPEPDGLAHYKFLSKEPVPEVVVERDMGAPPAFIGRSLDHLVRELENPAISQRYRLRRSKLNLLSGIPGSGKTFAIHGLLNESYRLLSEKIGVPVEDLPPRVMRLRSSDVLSKWLGDSDKLLARFFEELDQLASETFEDSDGRRWELPLFVIAEEIDALARARGEDGIHDRLLATVLEGFDPSRAVYRDRLVFVIATTNTSHLVDMAMIRRIGGRIESFGHMTRHTFRAVLGKLLSTLPFADTESQSDGDIEAANAAARARVIADTTAWLYSPNSVATGQVELTFVGQTQTLTKHHRDFLTAGLIDRAVQQACEEAANAEHEGGANPGITTEHVTRAIHEQVRHIVDLLTPHNCGDYLALPDAERVATLRRIDQPSVIPFELERAS